MWRWSWILIMVCFKIISFNLVSFFANHAWYPHRMVLPNANIDTFLRWFVIFLIQSSLPSLFWVEVVFAAVITINRLPIPNLANQSPCPKLFGRVPDYTFLQTFGCECFLTFTTCSCNKMKPRSVQCVFLGYAYQFKGYCCLVPKRAKFILIDMYDFMKQLFLIPLWLHNS